MMRTPLTQQALEKVGMMLTRDYGIKVVCQGTECRTDGHTIMLPAIPPECDEKVITMIRSYLDHEAGHLVGKTDFDLFKRTTDKNLHGILNILEDVRCEQMMSNLWAGCGYNLSSSNQMIADKLAKRFTGPEAETPDELMQLTSALFMKGKGLGVPSWVNDRIKGIVEAADGSDRWGVKDIPSWANGTSDLLKVARSILKEFTDQPEDQQPPQPPPPGEGDQSGDKDDDCSSSSPPPPDDKPEGNGGGKKGPGGGAGKQSALNPGEMIGDHVTSEARVTCGADGRHNAERSAHIHDSSITSIEIDPVSQDVLGSPYEERQSPDPKWVKSLRTMVDKCGSGMMRQRLEKYLMSEAKTGYNGGYTSGKPDPRRIAQLATGINNRVMRRRYDEDAKDTAVLIISDGSSSMYGKAMCVSVAASISVAETVIRCGHKAKVVAFVHQHCSSKITFTYDLICDWGFRSNDPRIMERGAVSAYRGGCGTPLGAAAYRYAVELAKRPEKRKIMFVMTDGSYSDTEMMRAAMEICRRHGISVIGVGIGKGNRRDRSIDYIDNCIGVPTDKVELFSDGLSEAILKDMKGGSLKPATV